MVVNASETNENRPYLFVVTQTTTSERAKKICNLAQAYVYYVSVKGVTGSAD